MGKAVREQAPGLLSAGPPNSAVPKDGANRIGWERVGAGGLTTSCVSPRDPRELGGQPPTN